MDIRQLISKIEVSSAKIERQYTQEQYDEMTSNIILAVATFFEQHYHRKFIIDEDNEKQVLALAYYFTNNPKFELESTKTNHELMDYSLRKGLLLLGDYGCGKSSLIHCFGEVLRRVRNGFLRYSFLDIDDEFSMMGYAAFSQHRQPYAKYYDDFGKESQMVGNYANKESVAVKIAELRYRMFVEAGVKTYYSTNLNGEGFKKAYSDWIYSRVKESCNVITFESGTKNRRLS